MLHFNALKCYATPTFRLTFCILMYYHTTTDDGVLLKYKYPLAKLTLNLSCICTAKSLDILIEILDTQLNVKLHLKCS